jgi:hypothetical protein
VGTYANPNGKSYTFNASPMTFEDAEQYCQTQNSHLTSYASLAEQSAAESFFIDLGVLLPGYHTFYWMGLNTSRWPAFRCEAEGRASATHAPSPPPPGPATMC